MGCVREGRGGRNLKSLPRRACVGHSPTRENTGGDPADPAPVMHSARAGRRCTRLHRRYTRRVSACGCMCGCCCWEPRFGPLKGNGVLRQTRKWVTLRRMGRSCVHPSNRDNMWVLSLTCSGSDGLPWGASCTHDTDGGSGQIQMTPQHAKPHHHPPHHPHPPPRHRTHSAPCIA